MIETRTPIIYLHFTILPGGNVQQNVSAAYNAFAYVVNGEASFGDTQEKATRGQMVMFAQDADEILIENRGQAQIDVLLIAGLPIAEPIARYGPFVMNTREEIHQAFADYQSGRMGQIDI